MKAKYFLLVISLSITHFLYAQEFKWANKVVSIAEVGLSNHNIRPANIKLDKDKNVYVFGTFKGIVDLNPGSAEELYFAGSFDQTFYSKYNQAGEYLWSKVIRHNLASPEISYATIDAEGNYYLTGRFIGVCDMDPGPGIYNITSQDGVKNTFVLKLDASGNFVWAKTFVGQNSATLSFNGLVLDNNNNILINGRFSSVFSPSAGVSISANGEFDGFILKLANNGDFIWVNSVTGPERQYVHSAVVNSQNDIYLTGSYHGQGAKFGLDTNAISLVNYNGQDGFICKMNANGVYQWVKRIGSNQIKYGPFQALPFKCFLDKNDNIYVAGQFSGEIDFDPGPDSFYLSTKLLNQNSYKNGKFLMKLNGSGDFVWAKEAYVNDRGQCFTTDQKGNLYTIGELNGTQDVNLEPDSVFLTSAGVTDLLVSKFDSSGNYVWAKSIGGTDIEQHGMITSSSDGNLFLSATFKSLAMDVDPGPKEHILSAFPSSGEGNALLILRWDENIGVGLNEASINQVKIYPNPASQQLTVNLTKPAAVEVYSITGKLMGSFNETTSQTIDVSEYAPGIYFLRTTYGNQKFIKE